MRFVFDIDHAIKRSAMLSKITIKTGYKRMVQLPKSISTVVLGLSLISSVFCSCANTPVEAPKQSIAKSSPQLQQEYRNAKALADAGDAKRALPRLKKIVALHPEAEEAVEARFAMGNLHLQNQQFNEAVADYDSVIKSPVQVGLETEALIRSSRALVKLGRASDAEKMLNQAIERSDITDEEKLQISMIRSDVFAAEGRTLDAIESLVKLSNIHPQPTERERYRARAQELVETKVSGEELRTVANEERFGFLRAPAKFRLALLAAEQRDYSQARSLFTDASSLAPGSELADRSNSLINQIDSRNKVDVKTIGVVLPLSGKQAAAGNRALRGIQLGLGIFGRNRSNFRLAVVDSEGNPDTGRRAVERLVNEDNVIAIIGGLLSKTATAEASKAQEIGVPMIVMSQKSGITQSGDFIFRNALTSQMQIKNLVEVAMGKLGMHNFAIMYPNDPYGVEYTNFFWDEVKAHGGNITAAQPYEAKETDFRGHVQRLTGTYYLEDRGEEYRLKLKAFQEKNPKRSVRQSAPSVEEIVSPVIDFDALFIPDSVRAVGQIAPMLAYNDVNNIRLLGTNLWDTPSLISRGQKFVENSVFVDGFLSTDPKFVSSDFFTNFKSTFDDEPGLTELQAYDSALILRQTVAAGETNRIGLQHRLASLQNFQGAIGLMSVNADREFIRPVTTLMVKDAKIVPFESIQQ